jgi:hypothetical protein
MSTSRLIEGTKLSQAVPENEFVEGSGADPNIILVLGRWDHKRFINIGLPNHNRSNIILWKRKIH